MAQQVIVVGAGIVGITAAYFEAQKGNQVVLIEASKQAGGLLRSSDSSFGAFDYGTHIAAATGHEALDAFLFDDAKDMLHEFDIQKSGSYFSGALTEFSPFINVNGLLDKYRDSAYLDLVTAPSNQQENDNAEQAIVAKFGQSIYDHALKPFILHAFGSDPKELPEYYINFFDMYRVVAFDEQTSTALKGVDYINDRIGFQVHTPGAPKFYPKSGGIGAWTEHLTNKVIKAGVEVMLDTQVTKMSQQGEQLHIEAAGKVFAADKLVWTVSSALLTRYLPIESKLQRPTFRTTALCDYVFEQPLETSCKYINNFDTQHIANRLTCYQNLLPDSDFYGVTVEVLVDDLGDTNAMVTQVESELRDMGLISPNNRCVHQQYRPVKEGFPVITKENDLALKALNKEIGERFEQITLLGRSSSKGFFMSELLIDAYKSARE